MIGVYVYYSEWAQADWFGAGLLSEYTFHETTLSTLGTVVGFIHGRQAPATLLVSL